MLRDTLRRWSRDLSPGERLAWTAWIAVGVFVVIRVLIWPRSHTVFPIFATAAQNWLARVDLYFLTPDASRVLDHYRYSPVVAVLLVPFGLLPDRLGALLWRAVNAAVYLGALGWWSRAVLPLPLTRGQRAALFLLALPLSVSSLNNGQSNALVIGLLLAATATVAGEHWNLASLCVALACLLKIYPLAVGLLLLLLYPRQLTLRLIGALAVGALLPFLFQSPEYVVQQYTCWFNLLWADDRKDWPVHAGYRDLWLLLRLGRLPVSRAAYTGIQLLAAASIALLCLAGRRSGWSRRWLLTALLTLAAGWMTLLGPATEACTYVLLAPTLAWAVLEAWRNRRSWWLRGATAMSWGLFLASDLIGWFPAGIRTAVPGLQPLAALVLVLALPILYLGGVRKAEADAEANAKRQAAGPLPSVAA